MIHARQGPVFTTFDDIEYVSSIVKMGTPCHIIGIRKEIRARIGKWLGDTALAKGGEWPHNFKRPE